MERLGFEAVIAVVRDIAFICVLLVVILVSLLVYWKVSKVLDSAKRVVDNMESITSLVSRRSGTAFGAGKLAAFLFGLRKKGKEGGKSDGERG